MHKRTVSRLIAGAVLSFVPTAALSPTANASTTVYYAYNNARSDQAIGRYTSLDAAKNAVKNIPGGVVKNSSWQFVYVQPSYYTYLNTSTNKTLNVYPNLLEAELSLMGVPGGVVKNSAWQFVFIEPPVAYYTYPNAYSNAITGVYSDLEDAESAVSGHPGAVVKNSWWQFVYEQPAFYTYANAYTDNRTGVYPTLQAAEAAVTNTPGALVKDSQWHYVYQVPAFFTYPNASANRALGVYPNLQSAIDAIQNYPGGVVKNSSWQFVYQQPVYYTYTSAYTNKISGTYPSLQAAEGAVANIPGALVKDSQWHYVYQVPAYFTYASGNTNQALGMYTTLQAAIDAIKSHPGGVVKNSSWQFVYVNQGYDTVDLRYAAPSSVTASSINTWINQASQSNSPLFGLGASYINAQNLYGADATYLLAHSIEESGWGKSVIATSKNNLFGYGAFTNAPSDAGVFPSEDYAIRFQAWEVRQNYLTPGAANFWNSPTLYGMNKNYATDSSWSNNISELMNEYVQGTGGNFGSYQQYTPQNAPSVPTLSSEPVYYLNGAQGTAQSISVYGGIPVFPDMGTGENYMLTSVLSTSMVNTYSSEVETLQRFLNTSAGGSHNIATDGYYGPNTADAVQSYQYAHSIPNVPTSVYNGKVYAECDLQTWEHAFGTYLIIPAGTQISIDQIQQGMYDGIVTEWYHVTGNGVSGWTNSNYVQFTNVYRFYPASGYTGTVNGQELHEGDYIVSNDGNTVQFYTPDRVKYAGAKGSATLTKITH